ncbi:MAG: MFS transporter [Chloroflexi bacterium]|nr:MFS transporter [Chloroflexota bacterium]
MSNQTVARPTITVDRPSGWGGRTFDSFRLPQYRLFWFAVMMQMAAMNMQMVAQAWLVYELTDSYTMLGVMALASAVPMLFMSLYGGALADRVAKKRVIVWGQFAVAVVALANALAITLGIIDVELKVGVGFLLGMAVAQGFVQGVVMPSRQSIIPEIVGPARLTNAVALNMAGMNINRLMAPALAGVLIALSGVELVYYAMAALNFAGLALIAFLKVTRGMPRRRSTTRADIMEGLSYVRNNTVIMGLLFLTLLSVLLSMPYIFLMPAFARDVQAVNPGEYAWVGRIPLLGEVPELLTKSSFRLGLLTSISGVGALVGSLIIASMRSRNRGSAFLWSVLGLGMALGLYAFTRSYALALLLIIGVGFTQSARMALSNALVQDAVDDEHRGRVMSIYMMEFGLSSFSTFGVAVLADVIGIQWAVGGAAFLLIPVALYYFAFMPSIRRMQ